MKRLGMIGAGAISRWHLSRWQQLPVEIVGHYDVVPAAAAAAAEQFGGRAFEDLAALLAEVDVVDICTPTSAHKEAVLAAAAAGVPMVCEKPLARRLADAEAMVAACETAGTPLFVAQVVRFFPQYARAKAVIEAGQIGRPGVIRMVRGGSFPGAGTRRWYTDFAQSGGVLMDLSIHDIDFARWCLGEVTRVFARGLTFAEVPDRDHALLTLRFAGGAVGHIEGSWAFPPGEFHTRFEIAGDEGLLEWDSQFNRPLMFAIHSDLDETAVTRRPASPLAPHDDPYYRELAHFLTCLDEDRPFIISPHDGLMAVKIALAAMASMQSGQPVDIADFTEVSA